MTALVSSYRDAGRIRALGDEIRRATTRRRTIMEVCGGQTHAIVKHGIDRLIEGSVELLHGPGCPVCVTPVELVDKAIAIAKERDVVLCSFGDMLRVPGSDGDLFVAKASGADVRVVYAPLDAVALAKRNPQKQIVMFAVGFETTAPAHAMALEAASRLGLENFSVLSSQVLSPPALASIMQARDCRVEAFLGPGHVCSIMGIGQYEALSRSFNVPIAVAGFEPVDLLAGLLAGVRQLERGEAKVEITYNRAVRPEGNPSARRLVENAFDVCDRAWRGVGLIPKSGLKVSHRLRAFDAEARFDLRVPKADENAACIAGQILRGVKKPTDCSAFGRACTPESPLGATMVSSEGACAAYYLYRSPPRGRVLEVSP